MCAHVLHTCLCPACVYNAQAALVAQYVCADFAACEISQIKPFLRACVLMSCMYVYVLLVFIMRKQPFLVAQYVPMHITYAYYIHRRLHGVELLCCACIGLARIKNLRCIYGICGREITKYTVIYSVIIRFWPALHTHPILALF
jgi:hypothetical protein